MKVLTAEELRPIILDKLTVPPDAHKGKKGHVLVIGGSVGHYGAVILAGNSALRNGAGLVTVAINGDDLGLVSSNLLELMLLPLAPESSLAQWSAGKKLTFVIGPGLGTDIKSKAIFLQTLNLLKNTSQIKAVFDADALNLLAANPEFTIPAGSILTPHPGEMGRLLKISSAEVQSNRLQAVAALSKRFSSWTILKGANTVISSPEGEIFFVPISCPALATAGSGDVLSGLLGALLGRGCSTKEAAIIGSFVHAQAGLNLERRYPQFGVIASDISLEISKVLNSYFA
jgi:hydroxyethylthiazole kinase-like uncharacterized protein yjeF